MGALANAAHVGSQMIGLRYRTYASPGATVDVLLPEGRRVKAVIGPDQIVATLNVHMATCEALASVQVSCIKPPRSTFTSYPRP